MKSKIINVVMFAVGAAIGSAVTYKFVRDQYEKIVQEEIRSIKEAFVDLPSNEQDQNDDTSDDEEDPVGCPGQINWDELEDLKEEAEEDDESDSLIHKYTALVDNYTSEKGGVEKVGTEPYVISPYDFGELENYHQIELTYHADEVLEDDEGNEIVDIEELIGPKALYTFGEFEDDAVFVRNEMLQTDFQILKDPRTYAEAHGHTPTRVNYE